jgi:hypothetical protein
MDHSPEAALVSTIEGVAGSVEAFKAIEKLRMRKAGTGHFVDVHVQAEPLLSLRDAHILSGRVKSAIRNAVPSVLGVLVHMEPFEAGLTTHKVLPRRSPHPHCPFSTRAEPTICVPLTGSRISRQQFLRHGLFLRRFRRERHLQSREIYPKALAHPPALTFSDTSLLIKVVRSLERKIDERLRSSTRRTAANRRHSVR